NDEGVDANCVICERSNVTDWGVVAPLANVILSVPAPPVLTLPAPLKVIFVVPLTVTPAAVVVGVTVQASAADLVNVSVIGIALPWVSYTVVLNGTAAAAPPALLESRLPFTVSDADALPVMPEPTGM